ncbi:proline racemase family protein [Prosthecobacter sp.]|uniref:proline racemase family protein n=1 Tax=Prosthecobacter sp. TaxID=1965333 RepID=UPI002488C748|nr:proline racemase family protein [Prosthecobacter sp.]MDI1314729.1 proline racemase family protein [Prosthecobacter sp.]
MPPPHKIQIIDSHTGGEPTRVVLSGVTADDLETYRRAIICEPRGHDVIVGALLVRPTDPSCAAGVIFFNNVGLLGMCGHGMIGLIITLAHLGRISPGHHRIETPVGIVTATLHDDGRVSIRNVPSHRKAKAIQAGGVIGDIAYGGNWFLLVSDHGLELTRSNIPQLTAACLAMRTAVHAAGHPEVDHIELIAPPHDATNHSRNFVLCPGGEYDRSPCGTGTSAKLACLAADGKLAPGEIWRHESIIGSVFEASYENTETTAIIPTITGTAFITAESTLILDPADPFRHGIEATTDPSPRRSEISIP